MTQVTPIKMTKSFVLFSVRKQEQKFPIQTLLVGMKLMHIQATNMPIKTTKQVIKLLCIFTLQKTYIMLQKHA